MYKYKSLLEKYLYEYKEEPYSHKILVNLNRFEDLYNYSSGSPLKTSMISFFVNSSGKEEFSKYKRAEYYLSKEKKLIKSFEKSKGKVLVMTDKGENTMFNKYPLQELREKEWNGIWTMICYDISNTNLRDSLRRLLTKKGFGTLQRSIMVSPLNLAEPINEFLKSKNLEEKVQVFSCKSIFGLPDFAIAEKVFNTKEINKLYDDLYVTYKEKLDKSNSKQVKKWNDYFLAVNYADPYLPYELLPSDWMGDECISLYKSKAKGILYSIKSFLTNPG